MKNVNTIIPGPYSIDFYMIFAIRIYTVKNSKLSDTICIVVNLS